MESKNRNINFSVDFINMFLLKYQAPEEFPVPGTNQTSFYKCVHHDPNTKLPCSSQTLFYENQVRILHVNININPPYLISITITIYS